MSIVRIGLLVLLAVLLPWQGVSAAVAGCAGTDAAPAAMHADAHRDHGMHGVLAGAGGHASDAHAGHDRSHRMSDDADPPADGPCGALCAAVCSVTAMPGTTASVPGPPVLASARFPDLVTPAPRLLADDRSRPPRSR